MKFWDGILLLVFFKLIAFAILLLLIAIARSLYLLVHHARVIRSTTQDIRDLRFTVSSTPFYVTATDAHYGLELNVKKCGDPYCPICGDPTLGEM